MSEKPKLYRYEPSGQTFFATTAEEILARGYVPASQLAEVTAQLEAAEGRVREVEEEHEKAMAAAVRTIGQLQEAIADVADGFEQQGKRGLASQLRQFLPPDPAPEAAKPVEQCPDCDQTGRHFCAGRRQVVEPVSPPSPAQRYESTNENVLADDFARAFACCGGNDEAPQGHCADCSEHPACPGCGNSTCECSPPSPAQADPCWCYNCDPVTPENWTQQVMRLCPKCGNKRCPKVAWHGFRCSGSNEVGQTGEPEPQPPAEPVQAGPHETCGEHCGHCFSDGDEPQRKPQPPAAPGTPLTVEGVLEQVAYALRRSAVKLGVTATAADLAVEVADELERAQKGGRVMERDASQWCACGWHGSEPCRCRAVILGIAPAISRASLPRPPRSWRRPTAHSGNGKSGGRGFALRR